MFREMHIQAILCELKDGRIAGPSNLWECTDNCGGWRHSAGKVANAVKVECSWIAIVSSHCDQLAKFLAALDVVWLEVKGLNSDQLTGGVTDVHNCNRHANGEVGSNSIP